MTELSQTDSTEPFRDSAQGDLKFFSRLATVIVTLTVVAFSTTYFLPVGLGKFSGEPVLHLHGLVFFAWPVIWLIQTRTAASSRRVHRSIGLAGISLATAMVILGLAAIGSSIESWQSRGVGLEGQTISVVAFGGLVMFAVFVALAIANTRQRIAHPRYMFLATLSIMQGAWGRLAMVMSTGGNTELLRPGLLPPLEQPIIASVAHFIFSAIFLAIVAWHDNRCHGAVQRVTLVGGSILLVTLFARHLLAGTAVWAAIANFLAAG